MAMGREGEVQGDLMMTWAEIPRSPGAALQEIVRQHFNIFNWLRLHKSNRGKFPGGGGRSQSLESMIQALDDSAPA